MNFWLSVILIPIFFSSFFIFDIISISFRLFLSDKSTYFSYHLLFFLIGLIIGPVVYKLFISNNIPFLINNSYFIIIIGGLLVGLGTKIGSGCTSGHGVCGISRFSIRSILATILFIFSGIITVLIMQLSGLTVWLKIFLYLSVEWYLV